jgi:hypothetical protein
VYQSSKGNKACFGMKQRIRGFQRRVWSQKKSMRLYEHRAYMYIYILKVFLDLIIFLLYIYIYTYYWSPTVARLGLSLTGSSLQKLRAYIRGDCILHLWKLLEENQQKQVTLYMSHLAYT